MNPQPVGPAQYTESQRQEWDQVAAGWKRWWPTFERSWQLVSDRLIDLAAIQPGRRVLDLATGIGEPAVTAARRVGPTGRVVATDISPQMLEIAAERVAAEGLSNIDFLASDVESLDLPDNTFDAVVCRFGLMFFPDVDAALKKVLTLLVPGGRFAASVWGPPDKVPMSSVPMNVMRRELQLPPPEPGTPGIFSLADANSLEDTFERAGFTNVRAELMVVTLEMASAEDFVNFRLDIAAPIRAMLADQPPARQQELRQAIAAAMRHYIAADGTVRIENEAILVVGQR